MRNPTKTDLAAELGQILIIKNWCVTTAESCTGGGVSHTITAIPGSSHWFEQGFVTYSNRAKQQLLGVDSSILEHWGAVSAQVVEAMAAGALQKAEADLAVAVSGIAGPDGGSIGKPVGTVWFAWTTAQRVNTECFHFEGNRNQIREQAILEALRGLIYITKQACL